MFRTSCLAFFMAAACLPLACLAQNPPPSAPSPVIEPNGAAKPANTEGSYLALRGALPSGDGVAIKNFMLEREGGKFTLSDGAVYFFGPVAGRVTGAVFVGKGQFDLIPQAASEQHSLALLAKGGVMSQPFSVLVLRFTDNTADELRKAGVGAAPPLPNNVSQSAAELAKSYRTRLHENISLRILEDVLSAKPGDALAGRYFLASFRMGGTFTGRNVLFLVDPEGTAHAAPDQVELTTWSSDDQQTWAAYKMRDHSSAEGLPLHVSAQKLDVSIERSGKMTSSAETTINVARDGLRVVRLNLYPTLRVSGVYSESGEPVDFVQESKESDPDFAIILPKGLVPGKTARFLVRYSGTDALRRDGSNVYYLMPGARETWYPSGSAELGDFADYTMTFHVPKYLKIVATGKERSHTAEPGGGERVVWSTDSPIAVAGFNLGDFKSNEVKTPDGFVVDAYANETLPDYVEPLTHGSLGSMTTTSALKQQVSEGSAAIQIYSNFFGKLPYDHVALTEQSACNFGQSWPMLVYLPICGFWDSTIQHALGLSDFGAAKYWEEVTPHEVAHQWWGQLVGFNSYRDQWMSEGFAHFSVGVYLLGTSTKMDDYRSFWKDQRESILRKNANGARPIDVGPVTMGYRANNEKTGDVAQALIYSKGAYIMHMLEMMYWTPQLNQAPFQHSLQQFVKDYSGKAATTEDFKASLEKTMPKWMDLRKDGKLDWFFDEYVYGTELPHYDVTSDISADGSTVHFKVVQSKVSDKFEMLVPLYLQMENGMAFRVGNLTLRGNTTIDQSVKVGKLPSPFKRMMVNYNGDILSE